MIFSNLKSLKRLTVSPISIKKFFSTKFKEQNIYVNSHKINFLVAGDGPKNILCFPGSLGSIWSDFKPQVEGLDKEKFTIIAWDPPGRGYSRPPDRLYHPNFYEEDANIAHEFLKKLGVEKCSLAGWSDGGISSIILASYYPETVENLITWGSNAYITEYDMDFLEGLRDTKKWSARAKSKFVEIYGEEYFQNFQNSYLDALQEIVLQKNRDICKSCLDNIKCPTLILHGDKDPIIKLEHPLYLFEKIMGSKLYRFPEGKHNIHLRYSDHFNELITRFILEPDSLLKNNVHNADKTAI